MNKTILYVACVLCVALALAQNYQCNWKVVDIGGVPMSSANYLVTPSVGQTATGLITGRTYQAQIGFWQIDTAHVGIREESHWSLEEPLATMLYAPFPNPAIGSARIRYSLAEQSHVSLQVFDLAGRSIGTLVNSVQKPGRYAASLAACRTPLAAGVYFLKMAAGDYQATKKLIVQ